MHLTCRYRKIEFSFVLAFNFLYRCNSLVQSFLPRRAGTRTLNENAAHIYRSRRQYATPCESNDTLNSHDISDDELILACNAFLQRKNRLGWERAAKRRALREKVRDEYIPIIEISTDVYKYDNDLGYEFEKQVPDSSGIFENVGIFTEFPSGPTERSLIRSRAKKAQWLDQNFRKRWYESRWGSRSKMSQESKNAQKRQKKILQLTLPKLKSEFASLTPSEIEEAISTYILSNRKRSIRRKSEKKLEDPVNATQVLQSTTEPLLRDSLFTLSNDVLREQQRIRSEKAQRAYQKRIENSKNSKSKPKPVVRLKAAKEALVRICSDLDSKRIPSLQDMSDMMSVSKLPKRRDVLQRIVNENPNLSGTFFISEFGAPLNLSQASVEQLGKLAIKLISMK
jgi:hypothetical protein